VDLLSYLIVVAVGYLLGAIPTGYLVGKAKGIDIRTVGSGNMGATNVFRVLGKTAGIFVLIIDLLKGYFAWPLAYVLLRRLHPTGETAGDLEWLSILAGISAILGHNYTCWLKFKGGKGVATTAGVLASLPFTPTALPCTFLIALVVFVIVFAVSKYVSLASITAAASLPVSTWFLHGSQRMIIVAFFLGALAIYKHKANIQRLRNGTENRFGKKKA
jgi:glycerol-3-phosphate acyltransferase PlsY